MKESSYDVLQKKQWRAITYNWDILSQYGQNTNLYCLTDFQVAWLLSNTEYFAWGTRWANCPCTENDMLKLKAEMEYNLMSCVDFQPYQLQYIYQQANDAQLAVFSNDWDGVNPSSVNPSAPDDYFNGNDSDDRNDALCNAVTMYVYSYCANWVTKASVILGIAIVVGLATSVTVVGGVIAGTILGGLAYMTSIALDAMQDTDALNQVICCWTDELKGLAPTILNFESALSACSFGVGTNPQIVLDILLSDVGNINNFLSFLNALGDAFDYVENGISICPCSDGTWIWTSDFVSSENIWNVVVGGGGARATWASGVGYSFTSNPTGASPARYLRGCQIQTDTFTPTGITRVTMTYNLTKGSTWVEPTTFAGNVQLTKNNNTVVNQSLLFSELVNGDNLVLEWAGDISDIKKLGVWMRSSLNTTASYSGSAKVVSVEVAGYGFNPFV